MGEIGYQILSGLLLLLLQLNILFQLLVCCLELANIVLHEVRHGIDAVGHYTNLAPKIRLAFLGKIQMGDLIGNTGDLCHGFRYHGRHSGKRYHSHNHHQQPDHQ